MGKQWQVIGGVDTGGILVREGQDLGSPKASRRLSTGALVEELVLVAERLHYRLVKGDGPQQGWVSVRLPGKELLVPKLSEGIFAILPSGKPQAARLEPEKPQVAVFRPPEPSKPGLAVATFALG